jgi:cytochrome P450
VILYFLSKHPDTLRALQEELATATEGQNFDMRKEYSVLDSVIKESLRLMPPFANGGQMVTPSLGLQIGDRYIPGGVIIKVPMYTLMRGELIIKILVRH